MHIKVVAQWKDIGGCFPVRCPHRDAAYPLYRPLGYLRKNFSLLMFIDAPHHTMFKLAQKAIKGKQECRASWELIDASENGYLEVARSLLNAGADKNAQTLGGRSALMCAASRGRFEVVQLFQGEIWARCWLQSSSLKAMVAMAYYFK